MFQCCSLEPFHPRLLPQSLKDCSINLCLFFFCSAYRVIINISIFQSLHKFVSIGSVMLSNQLILCHLLLLLPSIFPTSQHCLQSPPVFFNELALSIRWPNYWSFTSASVLPMNIQGGFLIELTGLIYS